MIKSTTTLLGGTEDISIIETFWSSRLRWASPRRGGGYSQLKRCPLTLMQHKLRRYELFKYPLLLAIIPALGIYARRRWDFSAGRGGERQVLIEGGEITCIYSHD